MKGEADQGASLVLSNAGTDCRTGSLRFLADVYFFYGIGKVLECSLASQLCLRNLMFILKSKGVTIKHR